MSPSNALAPPALNQFAERWGRRVEAYVQQTHNSPLFSTYTLEPYTTDSRDHEARRGNLYQRVKITYLFVDGTDLVIRAYLKVTTPSGNPTWTIADRQHEKIRRFFGLPVDHDSKGRFIQHSQENN